MPLLSVTDLQVTFHGHAQVRAVDGVSFELEDGETLGLVGESGCGKSATALSLMQLLPTATVGGEVRFRNVDLLRTAAKDMRRIRGNDISMIFQDPMASLNPVRTIGKQVAETLRAHTDLARRQIDDRVVELLELVGIPHAASRLHDYPYQFSGGMRQRVMIAIALACDPSLVLADEVTTALDVTIQAQILDLLQDLATVRRTAFILITHDLGVVARMAQRVHVMYAGRIVEKAPTATIFAGSAMPYTWGLLNAIPRLDQPRKDRLPSIDGQPPDLSVPMKGCRFAARCAHKRQICTDIEPPLAPVTADDVTHEARCWGTQNVEGGGWLRRQHPVLAGS